MKQLGLVLCLLGLLGTQAFAQTTKPSAAPAEHGGGNGGDDLEVDLKKRILQIGYFIHSDMGSKVFKVLNSQVVMDTANAMDIDVVSEKLFDKYGKERSCLNEPSRSLVSCNAERINELKKNKQEDILTTTLFHEILGLMEVELGYQENVSLYPISSKLLPYTAIVLSTPISEAQIRPEFYGLDNRSYGITLQNRTTLEKIRMICLNNNVEIHRCRNYAVVKSTNEFQIPLIAGVTSISPQQLAQINLESIKPSKIIEIEQKLNAIRANGYRFLTLKGSNKDGGYRFGVGCIHWFDDGTDEMGMSIFIGLIWGCTELDIVVEASKQVLNIGIFPIKAVINGIRTGVYKSKVKKLNKKIQIAREVLNLDNDLTVIGKTKKVSDDDFKLIIEIIGNSIKGKI